MEREGKYIYCIINSSHERNFGPLGSGDRGDEVLTIGCDDLSMVVSSYPLNKFVVSKENMTAHVKVIEEVMKEFASVLPVRFGTIASNADEIRNLLTRRYREFKELLKMMDHKVELGVKGLWKSMDIIFAELAEENGEIKKTRDLLKKIPAEELTDRKIELGRMVESALAEKKEAEAEKILKELRRISFDYCVNKTSGDDMFMNGAFLVNKGREKEFDNLMDDLSEELKDRVKFVYVGPLPVFNFVNVVIYPEEWEK